MAKNLDFEIKVFGQNQGKRPWNQGFWSRCHFPWFCDPFSLIWLKNLDICQKPWFHTGPISRILVYHPIYLGMMQILLFQRAGGKERVIWGWRKVQQWLIVQCVPWKQRNILLSTLLTSRANWYGQWFQLMCCAIGILTMAYQDFLWVMGQPIVWGISGG